MGTPKHNVHNYSLDSAGLDNANIHYITLAPDLSFVVVAEKLFSGKEVDSSKQHIDHSYAQLAQVMKDRLKIQGRKLPRAVQ